MLSSERLNFEASGNDYDFIKVCINDNADCCAVSEFPAPNCSEMACEIWDLELTAGDCASDTTYNLTINRNHRQTILGNPPLDEVDKLS